jgi:hypothetical protein
MRRHQTSISGSGTSATCQHQPRRSGAGGLADARSSRLCAAGLNDGDGFAIDASGIEADASRYHGLEPEKINWSSGVRSSG